MLKKPLKQTRIPKIDVQAKKEASIKLIDALHGGR